MIIFPLEHYVSEINRKIRSSTTTTITQIKISIENYSVVVVYIILNMYALPYPQAERYGFALRVSLYFSVVASPTCIYRTNTTYLQV